MRKLLPLFIIFLMFGCIDVKIKHKLNSDLSSDVVVEFNASDSGSFPIRSKFEVFSDNTTGVLENFSMYTSNNYYRYSRHMNEMEFNAFLNKLNISQGVIKTYFSFPYIYYEINLSLVGLNVVTKGYPFEYEFESFSEIVETNGIRTSPNSIKINPSNLTYAYAKMREPLSNYLFPYGVILLALLLAIAFVLKTKIKK